MEAPAPTGAPAWKPTICNFFLKGTCKFGEGCKYAHATCQLAPLPWSQRKTKLCKLFAGGLCNENDCMLAHGEDELKQRGRKDVRIQKDGPAGGGQSLPGKSSRSDSSTTASTPNGPSFDNSVSDLLKESPEYQLDLNESIARRLKKPLRTFSKAGFEALDELFSKQDYRTTPDLYSNTDFESAPRRVEKMWPAPPMTTPAPATTRTIQPDWIPASENLRAVEMPGQEPPMGSTWPLPASSSPAAQGATWASPYVDDGLFSERAATTAVRRRRIGAVPKFMQEEDMPMDQTLMEAPQDMTGSIPRRLKMPLRTCSKAGFEALDELSSKQDYGVTPDLYPNADFDAAPRRVDKMWPAPTLTTPVPAMPQTIQPEWIPASEKLRTVDMPGQEPAMGATWPLPVSSSPPSQGGTWAASYVDDGLYFERAATTTTRRRRIGAVPKFMQDEDDIQQEQIFSDAPQYAAAPTDGPASLSQLRHLRVPGRRGGSSSDGTEGVLKVTPVKLGSRLLLETMDDCGLYGDEPVKITAMDSLGADAKKVPIPADLAKAMMGN